MLFSITVTISLGLLLTYYLAISAFTYLKLSIVANNNCQNDMLVIVLMSQKEFFVLEKVMLFNTTVFII